MCERSEPIAMLTCYDFPSAVLQDQAGVDAVLVGDSVGTNILGYSSEQEVTMADMTHHVRAVRRGLAAAYLLADLPYNSYNTVEQALDNATLLLQSGADGVKLEGFKPEIIAHLTASGVQVCGHLGYTPQTAGAPGYRAKTAEKALILLEQAKGLESAGAGWLVLETVMEEVAAEIARALKIPVIGIGAGRYVDGQVLLGVDMLGITPLNFVHNRRFAALREPIDAALKSYVAAVHARQFPAADNARQMHAGEREAFERMRTSNLKAGNLKAGNLKESNLQDDNRQVGRGAALKHQPGTQNRCDRNDVTPKKGV